MILNSYMFGPSYDPDAQAFITAAAISNTSQQVAINNLVLNLKSYGVWSKMKAIYPMVGGSAASHKWNLKDPRDLDAAFRLVFTGGWTHSSTGALPNGTNAYANTYLDTQNDLSLNSGHFSFYSRTNAPTAAIRIDMGALRPAPDSYSDLNSSNSNATYFRFNNGVGYDSLSTSDSLGFFTGNRTAVNVIKTYKNGSTILSGTATSSSTSNIDIYIGAVNSNGSPLYYANRECAFATIGTSLTDAETLNFYVAVETFQTALGRNIAVPIVSDSDAQAFLCAANITNTTQANAVNQLVIDMKAANIWTKMKAVYPFVGGTASSHKWNLKNPLDTNAAFRLTFTGGWTHSSTGALPNGTNGYANSFFNLSTNFTSANKGSVGGYWRTVTPNGNYYFGVNDPVGGSNSRFWARHVGVPNKDYYAGGLTVLRDNTVTDYSGFSAMSRRSTTDMFAIKRDGTYITLTTSITIGFSNRTLPFAAQDSSGVYGSFSNSEIALGYISDDITQAEMTSLRNAVITFQTTLGRNV
jgi:hypothetical protein